MTRHVTYYQCSISGARVDHATLTVSPVGLDVVEMYFRGTRITAIEVVDGRALLLAIGFAIIDTTVPA